MESAHSVKGMTNMYSINPAYKTKKVLTFLADLIVDYDYDCYKDLAFCEKAELVSLLIEAAGKTDEANCLVESNNLDQIMGYFKAALAGSRRDDQKFLDIIKKNAIAYYEETMEALFDFALDDYRQERNQWLNDYSKYDDPDDMFEHYRESL